MGDQLTLRASPRVFFKSLQGFLREMKGLSDKT